MRVPLKEKGVPVCDTAHTLKLVFLKLLSPQQPSNSTNAALIHSYCLHLHYPLSTRRL